ncbi:zinc-dependent alcohol dehydrogenase family protein [Halostagnicola sp. A-GB9-2]|uniref:zinc-dependent alcohol dehydrogenase family protein n=1 Tax=Halostagnicola sp. A-GB9-2 TaxID=3048066 RepID=UPI0024BF6C89|nr:zinc-dependent alcohol dehydrogenase family protein [Halostagnicola sp. A-GB9-2]MDJ1431711.1 zinc-dependent alcohol dehydrogenase family protein [Halostagnicola sp. A-GB9-2]
MRAAVLEAYREPLSIESVSEPDLASHGIVVEVEACGVCRSDWHAWQGHGEWADDRVSRGQILGHEPAGRVAAVGGGVDRLEVGDRVAIPFNLGDGSCEQCRSGHGNVCADGLALGFESSVPGAFAERVHVPYADFNATKLPESVSSTDAAALGCRYVTAFHALAHRADVRAGDWIAVHGCGGLGLAAVQIAVAFGASVVAVDVRDEPLELAADAGADELVDASAVSDVPAAIAEAVAVGTDRDRSSEGRRDGRGTNAGVDVSVDALGRAETCRNSLDSLRIRGTHIQLGLTTDAERGEVSLPIDELTRWDIDFLGSRGMPPSRYDEILRMIASGRLNPGQLVTKTVALEDVSDRLAAMTAYETRGIEVVTEF